MKRIIIREVGPLQEVDIDLARMNVIVGPQSSGKSCVLKIACFCTWVEKRIELAQSGEEFLQGGFFMEELTRFHKLKGYFRQDSYIGYESDFTQFSYDARQEKFQFQWKENRWNYRRPKVSYIPAERNMVAAIPNWFDIKLYDDNIQSFMADWDRARKVYTRQLDILNLGVSYQYDEKTKSDRVHVDHDTTLELTNTSSGLQSLIPLFVHLNYIGYDVYGHHEAQSYANLQLGRQFQQTLEKEFDKTGIDEWEVRSKKLYDNFFRTAYSDIFLEEPENNLFPPTQARLVDWLLRLTEGKHGARLFVATHSPYIVTAFLERELSDFKLFFEKKEGGRSQVVTATASDVQEIYDDGIDVFYNIESYT